MNSSFRVLAPALALLSSAAVPALAADYDPPIIVDQPVEEVPIEIGSGWYLRGDIGYNFSAEADGGFNYRTFDPLTGATGFGDYDPASLGESVTFSGGFGYNFSDWIRADFTVDGFRLPFDGTRFSGAPCVNTTDFPEYLGTGCSSSDSATASAIGLMVNGYVDLGTYVGFTPYVGGGLGYTYVDWGSIGSNNFCTGAACPTSYVYSTEGGGQSSWRFTYAAMAGLAYDLTKNMKVDVGYRYRKIDSGPMFAFGPDSQATGVSVEGEDPGFTTHEVRVGLRYALW